MKKITVDSLLASWKNSLNYIGELKKVVIESSQSENYKRVDFEKSVNQVINKLREEVFVTQWLSLDEEVVNWNIIDNINKIQPDFFTLVSNKSDLKYSSKDKKDVEAKILESNSDLIILLGSIEAKIWVVMEMVTEHFAPKEIQKPIHQKIMNRIWNLFKKKAS